MQPLCDAGRIQAGMWWILGLLVYCLALAATLLFFAGCGKRNRQADERLARTMAARKVRRHRAA